jgi:deoxyhypusine synthase
MPHRIAPRFPAEEQEGLSLGEAHSLLPAPGQSGGPALIDEGFQAFNAARLGEACRIFTDKMLAKEHDTTIGLTVAGALTPAGSAGASSS